MKDPKIAFEGVYFNIFERQQDMFDGSQKTFQRIQFKDSVSILLFDGEDFIIGKISQPNRGTYLGLIGGLIEWGENPDDAIFRELLEETGYSCKEVMKISTTSYEGGILGDHHLYCGIGFKKTQEPENDAGEKVEILKIKPEELFSKLQSKEIRCASCLLPRRTKVFYDQAERANLMAIVSRK